MICRTCRSANTYMFLSLGLHPPANAFLTERQRKRPAAVFPLDVYACLDCGLIQVKNFIPAGFFRNYVYVPSASDLMIDHFSNLAKELVRRFKLTHGSLVVDIGSNDGTFLRNFRASEIRIVGIEPAANLARLARRHGVPTVNEYFSPKTATKVRRRHGPAAVIVATNTFNHIDDLHGFMHGVVALLDEQGAFVIEVPHALDLVEKNEFDTVYHEHLSQFSVKSIATIFAAFDMEIFDIASLPVHGGSMRIYGRRRTATTGVAEVADEWIAHEAAAGLHGKATYRAFGKRVRENKRKLWTILKAVKRAHRRIVGYGAPAKGNTLLNYYGIGRDTLEYLVDRSPLKHGLYSPGMHLPIRPVETILADRPEYLLLLAWNFADEIIQQQQQYRRLGGKFIIPIPEPRVVEG